VKPLFFLVGVNAEKYPDLVRRIVAEGHRDRQPPIIIQSRDLLPEQFRLELNATNSSRDDHRPLHTFSSAYAADTSPSSLAELARCGLRTKLNYLVVLEISTRRIGPTGRDVILQA